MPNNTIHRAAPSVFDAMIYGGYYCLVDNLDEPATQAYALIAQADSIVIDSHKHGLQPYGCGCVLFKDPEVGRLYKHDSPYTYFSSKELHLGEISLKCSRAGAAAVALWATLEMLPLDKAGEFAAGLKQCRQVALTLYERLANDDRFVTPLVPDQTSPSSPAPVKNINLMVDVLHCPTAF